jgi:hypothetical protein
MRYIYCFLILLLISSCKKGGETNAKRVEIYLLKSFSLSINQTTKPVTHTIANAILADTPFVRNNEIRYYDKATYTFSLDANVKERIKDYGPDKAFAVTVDGQPVYYGVFHPLYMSSLVYGLPYIDPVLLTTNNSLTIAYIKIDGDTTLQRLDRRNTKELLDAFKTSKRLR